MNTTIEIRDMNDNRMTGGAEDSQRFECKVEVNDDDDDDDDEEGQAASIIITDVKQEQPEHKETTEDESVAVEALRQLGENFTPAPASVPSTPPVVSLSLTDLDPIVTLREHICSICGESFERKTDLGNHIVCHQVDRPHACRVCGNLFRRKADLQNHMVFHQMDRPHRCPQCGTDFQRHSSLANHMKIHTYLPGRALVPPSSDTKPTFQGFSPDPSNKIPVPLEVVNGWNGNHPDYILPTFEPELETTDASTTISKQLPDNPVPNSQFTCGNASAQQQSLQSCNSVMKDMNTQMDTNCGIENFEENKSRELTNCTIEENSQRHQSVSSEVCFDNKIHDMQPVQKQRCKREAKDQKMVSERRPHICRHCGVGFSRAKALESHAKLHQDYWGSPLECEKCEEMFPEELSLKQHQMKCTGKVKVQPLDKDNKVMIPTPVSYQISNAKVHANNKTPVKPGKHQCNECEKKFSTKQKLYRHMWIHRKLQHLCETCGLYLENNIALDEHRRTHHAADTPHPCLECGKNFASRQGLWEHGRIHGATAGQGSAGNTALCCQQCGKKFSSRQGHLIHMRTHTGERPYGCRFCFKAFRDGGTLRKHERIHTGERPHACPLCYRAFNQKVVLREHVRWVHAAKNVSGCQCPLCEHVAADRESLCAHIVKHSDQMAATAKANKMKAKYFNDSTNTQNTSPSTIVPDSFVRTPNKANNGVQPNPSPQKKVKPIKKRFTCDLCGEKFAERTQLLSHVPIHI